VRDEGGEVGAWCSQAQKALDRILQLLGGVFA
jgi:hypothetical protein